ncbi:MAG: hypothetical protein ACYCV4_10670, partial [Dermatophilaceae bacterium]
MTHRSGSNTAARRSGSNTAARRSAHFKGVRRDPLRAGAPQVRPEPVNTFRQVSGFVRRRLGGQAGGRWYLPGTG